MVNTIKRGNWLDNGQTGGTPAEQSIISLIYWLSKTSNDKLGRQLGERDWTIRQSQLLHAIHVYEGASQLELTRKSGIDTSTVSRMLIRMASRGLISRRRSKKDLRCYTISLTPLGHKTLEVSRAFISELEQRLLAPLTPGQRRMLVHLMLLVALPSKSRHRAGKKCSEDALERAN